MSPFQYYRAGDVADAVARLVADPDARLLAGGMTLLPAMKHRLASPTQLVDVSRVAALRGIHVEAARVTVGAATRHVELADDARLGAALPALSALAQAIGDPQVRARGTLGGSLANNDPAADHPAAALALAAELRTDRRAIAADEFFQGMFTTALDPTEVLVAVSFRVPRRAAYEKFAHPASGYAMAGVFVADHGEGDVRVAVTGAGPGVFRWGEAERALAARFVPQVFDDMALSPDELNSDLHAPAAYRAHLAGLMARRAVARIIGSGR